VDVRKLSELITHGKTPLSQSAVAQNLSLAGVTGGRCMVRGIYLHNGHDRLIFGDNKTKSNDRVIST
jgi:hypothetical protein